MYFEELKVGQKFPGTSLTVTESHVVAFGSLTGDWIPLHFNEEHARASQFGRRIAHGMLTSSLALASVAPIMGKQAATHLEDVFTYKLPVFIGDTVTTSCEVTELVRKSRWGLVKMRLQTCNQNAQVVLEGTTTLGFHYRGLPPIRPSN